MAPWVGGAKPVWPEGETMASKVGETVDGKYIMEIYYTKPGTTLPVD
jgi:hypothetical protein